MVTWRSADHRGFRLQTRALDADVEAAEVERILSLPPDARGTANVALHTQIGIIFCPFCGSKLSRLIASNQNAFDALAADHAQFMIA